MPVGNYERLGKTSYSGIWDLREVMKEKSRDDYSSTNFWGQLMQAILLKIDLALPNLDYGCDRK